MRVITHKSHGIYLRSDSDPVRSPGVHLSGIIRSVALSTGALKSRDDEEDLDVMIANTQPENVGDNSRLMLVVLGMAWESWMAPRIPGMIHQPGELCLDGVYMSPDGIAFDEKGKGKLHEFKATWTTARKPIEDHAMWMWQAAGYLAALSEHFKEPWLNVVFHPVFMRGDYTRTGPQWPLYRPQEIEFEPEEIRSYWDMLLRNRGNAKPELVK